MVPGCGSGMCPTPNRWKSEGDRIEVTLTFGDHQVVRQAAQSVAGFTVPVLPVAPTGRASTSTVVNIGLLDLCKKLAKVKQAVLVFGPSGEFFCLDERLDIENAYLKILDRLLIRPLEEVVIAQTIANASKHIEWTEPRS